MKASNLLSKSVIAFLYVLLSVSVLMAGNINNKGTINNSLTVTVNGNFNNFKGVDFGTFNNTAGTFTVTGTYTSGGFPALATVSGGNFVVGGNYTNNAATTIVNGAGTLKLGGAVNSNVAPVAFTVSAGSVEYNRGGDQNVLLATYGGLRLSGSGNKTMDGLVTVNTTFDLFAGTLVVGANTLDIKTATLASTSGTLSALSGTVSYTGTGAQQVYPTIAYGNLTMTSTGPATKTAQGAITINGVYNSDANSTFDVGAGNAFATGGSSNLVASNLGIIKVNNTVTLGVANVGGTFDYTGNNQAVAIAQYRNLTLSGLTPSFAAGEFKVSGNLTATAVPGFNAAAVIHYNGTGSQAVAALTYALLKFSENSTKTISAATTATAAAVGSVAVDISINTPTLVIATGASLGVTLGQVSNANVLDINGTGAVTLTNGNFVNLFGANLNIGALATLTLTGDLENDGTITNAGTITVN